MRSFVKTGTIIIKPQLQHIIHSLLEWFKKIMCFVLVLVIISLMNIMLYQLTGRAFFNEGPEVISILNK